jgi:sulfur carrier protein
VTARMNVTVNGTAHALPEGTTVAALIAQLTGSTVTGSMRGVAVAVEGAVVPRSAWDSVDLRDGQSVELLTAVQGG